MSEKVYTVDFWRTDLHGEEIGIRQKEVLMSKSRQFTRDMDLYGSVKLGSEDVGYVGYRSGIWDSGNVGLEEKRLVVKAFSKSFSWIGSIEELVSRSVARSIGVGQPLPAFATVLADDKLIHHVEKIYRGPARTETYVLFSVDEGSRVLHTVKLVGKRVSLGADFDVLYGAGEKKVGKVDSKLLNVGGKVEVKLSEEVADNKALANLLVLFAATLRFQGEVESKIEEIINEMKKRGAAIKVQSEEVGLLINPRILKSAVF
ncbi:MAG: hypothetical protein KIH01_09545 [Candidatus Freyarchaeota archaeon]|nr:hypothetical protein [Candidatus Jordarchaeia archaeon]